MLDKPFELQFLEVLDLRYDLSSDYKYRIVNGQTGYVGEVGFIHILHPEIPEGWELVKDVTYDLPYGRIQIDAILIAPFGFFHYEVKNFTVDYDYKDGRWIRNGKELSRSPFTQLDRANEILRSQVRELNINVPIESKLILINEEDTVNFHDDKQADYLKRWQIKAHVRAINKNAPALINPKKVAELLKRRSIPAHLNLDVKGKEFVPDVRTGILCENCGSRKINLSKRYHIVCRNCGGVETKQRAILRTICDYGILHYDQPLTRKLVTDFIGERSFESNVKRVLRKYFELAPNGKLSEYVNPVNRMEYAFKDIEFRYENTIKKL